MTDPTPQDFATYPMGPNVRRFLGLDDLPKDAAPLTEISEADDLAFRRVILAAIEDHAPPSADALIDLIEELTAMNMADLALRLVECNSDLFPRDNAEAWIASGNAALISGDYVAAEHSFREA